MFSLVQFDNDEFYISISKRVKIIENNNCLVKYKGGTKYRATLIQRSDSEEQLREFQKNLKSEPTGETSNINHSFEIRGDSCSTPVHGISIPPPEHQITLSDIDGISSTTFGDKTGVSSEPPSGCNDLINIVGDNWMKDFCNNTSSLIETQNTTKERHDNDEKAGRESQHGGEEQNNNEKQNNYKERDINEGQANDGENAKGERQHGGEELNNNEKQNNYKERDINEGQANHRENAKGERQHGGEELNNNEKQNNYKEQEFDEGQANDGENAKGERQHGGEELNNNEKQNNYKEQEIDEGQANDGENAKGERLHGGEELNNNEKQNNYEEQEIVERQANDGENENDGGRQHGGEKQNNNEKQNNYKEQDIDEGLTNADKEGINVTRNISEEQDDEGRADYKKKKKNTKQNGIERSKYGESGNDTEQSGDESDTNARMQNHNKQYNQNYIDEENTDEDDDNIAKHSDYIPDQSSLSRTFQISKTNLTQNLSKSFNNASPVDIRSVVVPPSKQLTLRNTKRYFCPYCKKLQTKFARHLEMKHKSEADVKRFIKFPKGNQERVKIIETIRKHGNYLHNTDSNLNTGILITCRQRQPKYDRSVEDYLPCSNCKGFFSKQTLRLHSTKCNATHKKGARDMTVMGRRLTGYIHKLANTVLRRTVFPVMRDDEVSRSVKYDELLILFGNRLCDKYTHTHQYDMIRAQLRLLGRFKCAIKNINKDIDDFASIFHPQFYDAAVLAVRECAKYDTITQTFKTPAVATMLGTLLKKCISRRKAQCIRKQDYEGKKAAEEFLTLFEDDFPTTINKKVMEDQTKQKRQKKIILPSNQDIRRLYNFLKKKCQTSLKILENRFDFSAWKILTECTLILVQIFNRRRAGEIERLLITDYENQTELDENVNADLYAKLSDESKKYAKQFARLTIRGKLGRTVPVLLYPLHVGCIDTILKYRTEASVKSHNEYIFSVPDTCRLKKKYLRACVLMRKFSQECGAVIPTSLRGTTLRKHIATFFAMEGIGENEVADLANFMGHDKQIHKDVYRVPIPIREVTHVSRLLEAAMGESDNEESSDGGNESEDELNVDEQNAELNFEPNNESNDESNNESSDESNYDIFVGKKSMRNAHMGNSTFTLNNNTESKESCTDDNITPNTSSSKRRSTSPYGKTKRMRWTTDEKIAVKQIFGDPAALKKLPSFKECQETINKCKLLRNRKPQVLKTWIDNQRKAVPRRAQYLNRSKT